MFYVYIYSTPCAISLGKRISILPNTPFYIGKGKGNRWKDHILMKDKIKNYLKIGVIHKINNFRIRTKN